MGRQGFRSLKAGYCGSRLTIPRYRRNAVIGDTPDSSILSPWTRLGVRHRCIRIWGITFNSINIDDSVSRVRYRPTIAITVAVEPIFSERFRQIENGPFRLQLSCRYHSNAVPKTGRKTTAVPPDRNDRPIVDDRRCGPQCARYAIPPGWRSMSYRSRSARLETSRTARSFVTALATNARRPSASKTVPRCSDVSTSFRTVLCGREAPGPSLRASPHSGRFVGLRWSVPPQRRIRYSLRSWFDR